MRSIEPTIWLQWAMIMLFMFMTLLDVSRECGMNHELIMGNFGRFNQSIEWSLVWRLVMEPAATCCSQVVGITWSGCGMWLLVTVWRSWSITKNELQICVWVLMESGSCRLLLTRASCSKLLMRIISLWLVIRVTMNANVFVLLAMRLLLDMPRESFVCGHCIWRDISPSSRV